MPNILHYLRRLASVERARDLGDWDLVERFVLQRDEAAFAVLVDRHGPMLYALCRRVTQNDQDAEDALQATFLVFVRKADTLQHTGSLKSWLHGVAVRLAQKARDKTLQQARLGQRSAEQGSSRSVEPATLGEVQAILDEELAALPDAYRSVILLCCLEGKTRDEAALELRCKPGAVKIRLERGRELLRQRLARRGLTLSVAVLSSLLTQPAAYASVPVRLVAGIVAAGTKFAAGQPIAEVASAAALTLAEAALRATALAKVKLLAVALCVGFFALAGSVLVWQHRPARSDGDPLPTPQQVRPDEPKPARSWQQLAALEGHKGPLWAIAFAPDGRTVATGGEDRFVLLWDLQRQKQVGTLGGAKLPVRSLWFSADQAQLYSFEDRMVRLWDLKANRQVREFHVDQLGTLSSDPEGGGRFLGKVNGRVGLFGLDPMTPVALVPPFDGEVVCALPRVPGVLAFGRTQGTIRLWNTATRKEAALLAGHRDAVTALAFTPDGRALASADREGRVLLWDVTSGEARPLAGHRDAVLALAFTPDGKTLATGSADRTVKLRDAGSGAEQASLPQSAAAQCVAFSSDGATLAVGTSDHRLTLWKLQEPER